MNNLIDILKIELLSFLGINKIRNSHDSNEHKKLVLKIFIFLGFGILLLNYMYKMSDSIIIFYKSANQINYFLLHIYIIYIIYIFLFNVLKSANAFLKFKDYDLLLSLPISHKIIVLSRFIILYLYNLIIGLFIMIPSLAVYLHHVDINEVFLANYLIMILIIPIIPIILSSIVGIIIDLISSKFKMRSLVNIIISLLIMVMYMFLNLSDNSSGMGITWLNGFQKIFPLSKLYLLTIEKGNLFGLLLYFIVTVLGLYLFIEIFSKCFLNLKSMSSKIIKTKTGYRDVKPKSILSALIKKEAIRYFKTPLYFLNTAISLIILLFITFYFGLFKKSEIIDLLNYQKSVVYILPFLISILTSLCTTTHCSLSLEGRSYWILQYLPVNLKKIIFSKIIFNILIVYPVIILVDLIIFFQFPIVLSVKIFSFIIPALVVLICSTFGMILDCIFLNLSWNNEAKVIKQRIPALISMIFNLLISLFPLIIDIRIKEYQYLLLITMLYLVIAFILLYFLLIIIKRKEFNISE